ncbi:MAG: hypothetical protein ACJA1R_003335, partial [Flavobacteriales bacterium]
SFNPGATDSDAEADTETDPIAVGVGIGWLATAIVGSTSTSTVGVPPHAAAAESATDSAMERLPEPVSNLNVMRRSMNGGRNHRL